MNVQEAIISRRARRILDDEHAIGENEIEALAEAITLAPSCFNNQPWRITFVHELSVLEKIRTALSRGNEWATKSRLILVIAAKREEDCVIGEREYFLFDAGLAIGELMLRATELGMIAHPIAGFNPGKVKEILNIPDDYIVISLVICGYPGTDDSLLSGKQKEAEKARPERKQIGEMLYRDGWGQPLK